MLLAAYIRLFENNLVNKFVFKKLAHIISHPIHFILLFFIFEMSNVIVFEFLSIYNEVFDMFHHMCRLTAIIGCHRVLSYLSGMPHLIF